MVSTRTALLALCVFCLATTTVTAGEKESFGFRFGGAVGWVGSMPRGSWHADIVNYMGAVEPQFGSGINASVLLHFRDSDVSDGAAAIPFPIIAAVIEYDQLFMGHFDDVYYVGGTWESRLYHRFFNITGGMRLYPFKFHRAWTPFLEYGLGYHRSSFPAEPWGGNEVGHAVVDNDGNLHTVEDGSGMIHKISIGHDFRFGDIMGLLLRTIFGIGSKSILEPLRETFMYPDFYNQNLRSFDIRVQLYLLTR